MKKAYLGQADPSGQTGLVPADVAVLDVDFLKKLRQSLGSRINRLISIGNNPPHVA